MNLYNYLSNKTQHETIQYIFAVVFLTWADIAQNIIDDANMLHICRTFNPDKMENIEGILKYEINDWLLKKDLIQISRRSFNRKTWTASTIVFYFYLTGELYQIEKKRFKG